MAWKPVFVKSTRAGKKYSVITPSGRCIHFGSSAHQHYRDVTGVGAWSKKDHLDTHRRNLFRSRFRNKRRGKKLAHKDKESPLYYSWKYLW